MLRSVPVAKCLDQKLTVFGFEVPDLFAIFLLLSVLHLLLGDLGNQFFLIWLPTVSLALTLWFGKRGKPENHLIHWTRFYLKPGTLSAFEPAQKWEVYRNKTVKK